MQALFSALYDSGQFQRLQRAIRGGQTPCSAFGVADSQKAHLASAIWLQGGRSMLIITESEVTARLISEDFEAMTGEAALVFAPRPVQLGAVRASSREVYMARLSVLASLLSGERRAVIAPVDSVMQPLAPKFAFDRAVKKLKTGMRVDLRKLSEDLVWMGYARTARVESHGQFSLRGDIFDIFPTGFESPLRLEFFGDELEKMRSFDILSQRSGQIVSEAVIFPAVEMPLDNESAQRGMESLMAEAGAMDKAGGDSPVAGFSKSKSGAHDFTAALVEKLAGQGPFEGLEDYIKSFFRTTSIIFEYMDDPIVLLDSPARLKERAESVSEEYSVMLQEALKAGEALASQSESLLRHGDLLSRLKGSMVIAMDSIPGNAGFEFKEKFNFQGREPAVYRSRFDMLKKDVDRFIKQEYVTLFLAGDETRAKRLKETFDDFDIHATVSDGKRAALPGECLIIPAGARRGFEYGEASLAVFTARELFGITRQKRRARGAGRGLEVLNDFKEGDYAVHEVHGIGIYKGIVKLEADGNTRDYLRIDYKDNDVLYVPTEQMDRVQKYIGSEGAAPKVNSLGGNVWQHTKGKVKKEIEEMAEDLIKLYAERSSQKGFAFSPDGDWQLQFEDSFPYEETPDQITCINEIKIDMENPRIMDRLLCGDVGYGKTEVALRAVFKAVMDKKQAAILCPTTILAHQHFETMKSRFGDFPIEFAELSRFLSPAEQDKVVAGLRSGQIDVVVGTHRLLSKDIAFADLGLLVVDEEQRFGVTHKEKIKKLKAKVDVLTLSATPIPRTLHMSLSGIRDISIIDTPPEDRHPVQTFVTEYDESMIRSAILRELGRGGQIYFLYNRVESMDIMASRLKELVPEAGIAVAHGQMKEHALENTMISFLNREFDLLLCTTIIESGLDIPSVNTLIVFDADRFGLSQLYQLRGRVGRSNRLAYAYFTWRPMHVITENAEKRLEAISEFTEFGSGLKIAMRDLEIRGAGDLLGARQHGNMATVGYGLYCKLIDEAVRTLKGERVQELSDITLNLQINAHIPGDYIEGAQDRLDMYRRIAYIENENDKQDAAGEMSDRFGPVPQSVLNLLDVAHIKALGRSAGIELIRQQGAEFTMKFHKDAVMDPVKLMGLVNSCDGALKLVPGENTILRYGAKTYESSIGSLIEMLGLMSDCKAGYDVV